MLRKDVVVQRPEGTKIYRQRNCVYVYHVTGSEYKKDKKYVVEKRVCIGKMIDDENMIPNDNFYQYYEIEGGNEEKPPRFSDAIQVGAASLIFKVMEDLKISELLESIHGKEDADLIKQRGCIFMIYCIAYIYLWYITVIFCMTILRHIHPFRFGVHVCTVITYIYIRMLRL